jgi:ubiquinone/menaquinone biosynthesis C-methylase UbiE
VGWFRKSAPTEPLGVTMAGVKLGDRFLAVGVRDPVLIAALAAKAGLTGQAHAIEADEARGEKARVTIEQEGALIDVTCAPWSAWPRADESIDVAVMPNLLPELTPEDRARAIAETFRVLRPGGRVIVIDGGRRGLLARSGPHVDAQPLLREAGFAAVRLLAETGGTTYVEGIKKA